MDGNGGVLRFAMCWVVCSAGRCIELCLIIVHELCFLASTSIDLVAVEQRQGTKKGRLKPSNVHNIGNSMFPCKLFPHNVWSYPDASETPSLGQAVRMFPCRLLPYSARPYAGPGE